MWFANKEGISSFSQVASLQQVLFCVNQAYTTWFFFLCSSNVRKIQNIAQHCKMTGTKVLMVLKVKIPSGTMTSPYLIL